MDTDQAESLTWFQVLRDRIPFYEYNDLVVMFHIFQGERPKKPRFAITRGYTEELWDMTTSCWDADPAKRPTVDHILDVLIIGAEQWKPKHGGLYAHDDRNATDSEEEWDSPVVLEPESEPIDGASGSLDPPRSLVIETPVPVPPSIFSPSTVKNHTQLASTPITSMKKEITSLSAAPPEEEEPRPNVVISKEMEPTPAGQSREEGHQPIPVPSSDEDIRDAPVVPSKQEKPKLALVTSEGEVRRLAPDRRGVKGGSQPDPAISTKPLLVKQ